MTSEEECVRQRRHLMLHSHMIVAPKKSNMLCMMNALAAIYGWAGSCRPQVLSLV